MEMLFVNCKWKYRGAGFLAFPNWRMSMNPFVRLSGKFDELATEKERLIFVLKIVGSLLLLSSIISAYFLL